MMTVVSGVPPTPLALLEREPADPTAMTIAVVRDSETRWGKADVAACLAELAITDELVVVYGSDDDSEFGAGPVVAELRGLLPRYTVVALYAPDAGHDIALLEELLEVGSLPVVITPATTESAVAGRLSDHLRADRVVSVHHSLAASGHPHQRWQHRATVSTCSGRAG